MSCILYLFHVELTLLLAHIVPVQFYLMCVCVCVCLCVLQRQDWSLCHDGTRHPGAVKGAVQDFHKTLLSRSDVTVSQIYQTGEDRWYSWYFAVVKHSFQPPQKTMTKAEAETE